MVYDAGQNSDDNYTLLDGSPLSFVGSLPPSDHPDLLAVGKDRYAVVDPERFRGLVAFETTKVVFGKERRLVGCHSDGLHEKQSRGFDQTLAKANRQLAALEDRLARGRTRKSKEKVETEIAAILAARMGVPGDHLDPRWRILGRAPSQRCTRATRPGPASKSSCSASGSSSPTSLPQEAPTARIIAEYRSQETVEGDFRQMKDPKVVSFSPMFHWTESKIRVHVFYCVLVLMVARLMVRQADRAGIHLSVRELLATLAGIEETVLLYHGETGRPRARRMLTDMDQPPGRLYELFNLDAYAPKR